MITFLTGFNLSFNNAIIIFYLYFTTSSSVLRQYVITFCAFEIEDSVPELQRLLVVDNGTRESEEPNETRTDEQSPKNRGRPHHGWSVVSTEDFMPRSGLFLTPKGRWKLWFVRYKKDDSFSDDIFVDTNMANWMIFNMWGTGIIHHFVMIVGWSWLQIQRNTTKSFLVVFHRK